MFFLTPFKTVLQNSSEDAYSLVSLVSLSSTFIGTGGLITVGRFLTLASWFSNGLPFIYGVMSVSFFVLIDDIKNRNGSILNTISHLHE